MHLTTHRLVDLPVEAIPNGYFDYRKADAAPTAPPAF
jgi:hypothetical protein